MSDSCIHGWGACQAPLSMGFPRQEYWSVLHFFSRESSRPRDQTHISCRWILHHWATREAPLCCILDSLPQVSDILFIFLHSSFPSVSQTLISVDWYASFLIIYSVKSSLSDFSIQLFCCLTLTLLFLIVSISLLMLYIWWYIIFIFSFNSLHISFNSLQWVV